MFKHVLIFTTFTTLVAVPSTSFAQGGTLTGAVGGAAVGAIVGGPIGAAVGGAVGSAVGGATDTVANPPERVIVDPNAPRVMHRSCIEDAYGNRRCREIETQE